MCCTARLHVQGRREDDIRALYTTHRRSLVLYSHGSPDDTYLPPRFTCMPAIVSTVIKNIAGYSHLYGVTNLIPNRPTPAVVFSPLLRACVRRRLSLHLQFQHTSLVHAHHTTWCVISIQVFLMQHLVTGDAARSKASGFNAPHKPMPLTYVLQCDGLLGFSGNLRST